MLFHSMVAKVNNRVFLAGLDLRLSTIIRIISGKLNARLFEKINNLCYILNHLLNESKHIKY